jgi:hypothetical protein
VFDTHIGVETEHTPIGDVGLVILVLVSAPLADVVHKFKFIELTLRALRDVGMLDVVHKFKSIELIFRALRDVGMLCMTCPSMEVVRLSVCKRIESLELMIG